MAKYKDIVGTAIRNNAGNLPAPETGQIFFDSTNIDFKYQQPNKTSAASWSTAASMNTARAYNFATAGDKTAALNFGGNEPPGAVSGKTESFDIPISKSLIGIKFDGTKYSFITGLSSSTP